MPKSTPNTSQFNTPILSGSNINDVEKSHLLFQCADAHTVNQHRHDWLSGLFYAIKHINKSDLPYKEAPIAQLASLGCHLADNFADMSDDEAEAYKHDAKLLSKEGV